MMEKEEDHSILSLADNYFLEATTTTGSDSDVSLPRKLLPLEYSRNHSYDTVINDNRSKSPIQQVIKKTERCVKENMLIDDAALKTQEEKDTPCRFKLNCKKICSNIIRPLLMAGKLKKRKQQVEEEVIMPEVEVMAAKPSQNVCRSYTNRVEFNSDKFAVYGDIFYCYI